MATTLEVKKNAATKPKWVLMVHMSATAPNLAKPLELNLKEMIKPIRESGAKRDVVHVYVQIDTPTGVSKRFWLTAKGPVPIDDAFATDAGSTLVGFVQFVASLTRRGFRERP